MIFVLGAVVGGVLIYVYRSNVLKNIGIEKSEGLIEKQAKEKGANL